jgi:hypothetical protein
MCLKDLDWTLRDGRRVSLAAGLDAAHSRVASGVFDRHWRRDDRWIVLGDADVRGKSPVRHPPADDFTLPAKTLDSYVGDYEFFPGLLVSIARTEAGLTSQFAGFVSPLTAESATDFGIHDSGGLIVFQHDAQGTVGGLIANNGEGREFFAKRLSPGQ